MKPEEIKQRMEAFTAIENLYGYFFTEDHHLCLSDGAYFILKECNAAWFFDMILYMQLCPPFNENPIQIWTLKNLGSEVWRLECINENSEILTSRTIPDLDFPIDELTIIVDDEIVRLPAEHIPDARR